MKLHKWIPGLLIFCSLWGWSQQKDKPIAMIDGKPLFMEDVANASINDLRQKLYDEVLNVIKHDLSAGDDHVHGDESKVNAAFEEAVKAGRVQILLDKPNIKYVTLDVDASRVEGNASAPVLIMEFTDTQCGFCTRVAPTIKRLRRNFGKDLAFMSRHLPLPSNDLARAGANALECAREQGKYDILKNAFMANPKRQKPEHLERYGRQMELDLDDFMVCVTSDRHGGLIQHDMDVAAGMGLEATPGFVIGRYDVAKGKLSGEVVEGALSLKEFTVIVNKYLKN